MQPKPRKPIPKRALPNKPLPSRPLPGGPQKSPSPQPPQQNVNTQPSSQQSQQPQQQPYQSGGGAPNFDQLNNMMKQFQPNIEPQQEAYSPPEPEPEPVQQPEPDPEPEPEPEPVQQSEPNPNPEPISQEVQIETQASPQPVEEQQKELSSSPQPAANNNWYKPRQKPQRSFKKAKTCKLLLDDKRNKVKKVKLFQTFDKFFVAEGNSKNRGFQVASITNNEFGEAFSKMGIESGWRVTKIGNTALKMISFPMLKNQLISTGQKAGDKGYYLVFDGNPPKKEDESKMDDDNDGLPSLGNAAPVSMGKNSVELISGQYNDHKIVKIKHSLDKYIDFEAVKGPKGYKISGFKAKFGADLQQYGIGIGWRVTKLGDKDVSNMFTQMIKTNLDVEWRNNGANGIIITFGQPL